MLKFLNKIWQFILWLISLVKARLKRLLFHDLFGMEGTLMARVKRAGSDVFEDVWPEPIKNLITNAGLSFAAYALNTGLNYFALAEVGEGTTSPTVADVNLEDWRDSDNSPTISRVTTAVSNDTSQIVSAHTAGFGGWDITEYGLRAFGGQLFNRVVFTAIHLNENDVLEFTYKVQITRV